MSNYNKIQELFLENPDEEFHVRKVAKTLNLSPSTATKYLDSLEREELIMKKEEYNHNIYRANIGSENYKHAKTFFNIEKLNESGLLEFLDREYNNPEAIILYGSYALGEDGSKSDIDIAIITTLKKNIELNNFENKLKKKIQILELTNKEVHKNKHIGNKLINGIILRGYWELLK